jgi:ABC-type transporter Mla maintaining outer membrane lipid asymmetry ATPase subunit MlaF
VATNRAIREKNGDVRIATADPQKEQETEFLMLRDGLIVFEGDARALRSSEDEYLKKFLS